MTNRVGGLIAIKVDGETLFAKGNFTYNLGIPRKEAIIGSDAVHGYKETPQVAFIEGEITDRREISMEAIRRITDATITLQLANSKVIVLRQAWEASEGTGNTEEGNHQVRFESRGQGEEIR